jgi:hypothetical protein
MTYTIVAGGQAIRCDVCGATSWNRNDVKFLYCGRCNRFHEDRPVS